MGELAVEQSEDFDREQKAEDQVGQMGHACEGSKDEGLPRQAREHGKAGGREEQGVS